MKSTSDSGNSSLLEEFIQDLVCLEACVEYSMCVSRLRYTMKSTSDSGNSSLLQPPPSTAFLNPCSCSRRAEFKNGLRTSSPNKNRGDALGIRAKGLATISDSLSLSFF